MSMNIKQQLETKNKSLWTNTCEYIVLHHTATGEWTIKWVLRQLTVWPVSCHFVVDTNWDIYKIGQLQDRLWHAGISEWDWKKDMNKYSIGIEIIWPLPWFTNAQRKSVRELVTSLITDLKLPVNRIIRHKDIAPKRKNDVDDSFWNNEYKTFTDYQNSYISTNTPLMSDNTTQSKFKAVYEKELTPSYIPTFSTHDDPTPATIGDIKYLIEINNIRKSKK